MAQVKYSKAVVKRAIRHQVRKALGTLYWIALALLGASFVFGVFSGRHDWFFGLTGTILVQACLVPLIAIRMRTNASLARLIALGEEGVSIDMNSGRFRAISSLGSIDLPLSRITTVTCSPDYWLLKSGRSTMMMLPTADIPWPTVDGWLSELRKAGAKVE